MFRNRITRIFTGIIIVILLLGLAACAQEQRGEDAANAYFVRSTANVHPGGMSPLMTPPPPAMAMPMPQQADMAADSFMLHESDALWEDVAGQAERHLIRRASIEAESEYFDEAVAALRAVAPAVNGYIESEMLTATGTPRLTIVLRVPAATFDDVLRHINTLVTIQTQNQWTDDVTDRFYDLAGNLETRRIEEERVLALIDQAGDIHELLALEARLSNVRHAIESYLAQLNQMAGQITYSTITVTLVCAAIPITAAAPTLGYRIGGAFGDSVDGTVRFLQGVVVLLAGAVIPLGLLAILGGIIWLIVRRVKKKRAEVSF